MSEINFYAILAAAGIALVGSPVVFYHMGYGWAKIVVGTLVGLIIVLLVAGFINRWLAEPLGLPLAWLAPLAYLAALVWGWTHKELLQGTEHSLPPED